MAKIGWLSAVPNKRAGLARVLTHLGVTRLLELAAARKPGLAVLTYHRIAEPATNPFYDHVVSATPAQFRRQVAWLKSHFECPSLDEVLDHIQAGRAWQRPAVLITFDDGCRDNHEIAAPILAEAKMPAVFFLVSGFLEAPRLPWWDEAAYLIKHTRVSRITLESRAPSPLVLDLEATPRDQAIMAVVRRVLDAHIADPGAVLDPLRAQAEVTIDQHMLASSLFMNWEQAADLRRCSAEFAIGSHSHTHPRLAALLEDQQRRELVESKRLLEERLGITACAVAYPYGGPGAFSDRTRQLAQQAGYRLGFSALAGWNRIPAQDCFALTRFNVGLGDDSCLLRNRLALDAAMGRSFL